MDVGNMHLKSELPTPRCVCFNIGQIPKDVQQQCQLAQHVNNGFACARITKAWHGLKESSKITGDDCRDLLAIFGCNESKFTPGFFTHESGDINSTLVVDDFGVKCKNVDNFEHLRDVLSLKCDMKVDMEAKQHVGVDLECDCEARTLDCNKDWCIATALQEFKHALPEHVEDNVSRVLTPGEIKCTQEASVNSCSLREPQMTLCHMPLNNLACNVTKGAEKTLQAAVHLLNCIASNPKPQI